MVLISAREVTVQMPPPPVDPFTFADRPIYDKKDK